MYTRSQKHQFAKQCEKCGQFNCCTHLPKQDSKYYNDEYKDKVIKYLNPLIDLNLKSNDPHKCTVIMHNIFNYVLRNIIFLIINKNMLEITLKKANEFKNNNTDLKFMGKSNLEYYLYWLNHIDKYSHKYVTPCNINCD